VNVLAIDQGTSATKALVVDPGGRVLAEAEVPIGIEAVGTEGVIQDPIELLASILEAGSRALIASGVGAEAVALANQGEAVVAWDRVSGDPLSPVISWQDRRSTSVTDGMGPLAERVQQITGLPLDPYFTAPKLAWLRERSPSGARVTSIDAWINHQLFGESVTDASSASRSALLDLDERRWSPEAVTAFGLELEELPRVVDCAGAFGETDRFGPRLPVTGLVVDQQAALIGEGCLEAGQAKCTYGTGAFLLVTTGERAVRSGVGLSASVAWQGPGDAAYCLDGQAYTAGSAVAWLERLGLLGSAAELDAMAVTADPSSRALCVPAFAGLGAPRWAPRAKASFEGLTLGSGAAELVLAVLESLACQVAVLGAAAAADLGSPLRSLKVDGGLTRSRFLMQLQADLLQIPVEVFSSPHATALGTAALGRWGAGGDARLRPTGTAANQTFEPSISADEAAGRLERWDRAVDRAVAAAEDDA
jgi:glycerol kinase